MEGRGMVEIAKMRELVKEDVILEFRRNKDEAPVKRNGAGLAAGSPAAFLVAHGHSVYLDPNTARMKEKAGGKVIPGKIPKKGKHLLF